MNPELMKLQGAFSWNELLTSDVAGAKRFYGELLGWTLQDTNEHGVDYTLAKVGETPVGGSVCVPPQDIPGLGRFAVIQDPQGARLTLITYTCLTQT